MKSNLLIFILGLLALALTACNTASSATEAITDSPTGESPATDIINIQPEPTATPIPPSPTAALTTTATPEPTATHTPLPTPTSTRTPSLRQLTEGGCCVQPFFSPDGQRVLFIDKPSDDAPVGIYGVDVVNPRTPTLVEDVIGFRSEDRTIVATIEGDVVRFVNEETDESWLVNTGGNWPRFSPDGRRLLWQAQDQEGPYDQRQSDIWLAELDGSSPQLLTSVTGGGFTGWLPDSRGFLLINRDSLEEEDRTLILYDLENDRRINLAREKRLRGIEISPQGSWIAYFLTFADDSENDGLWVVSSDGAQRFELDIPGFGAYRWRDDKHLIYIPMRTSSEQGMQLWEIDVEANQTRPLTDSAALPFSISNGDWEVSPDGKSIIFVNSEDQNIWLITLS